MLMATHTDDSLIGGLKEEVKTFMNEFESVYICSLQVAQTSWSMVRMGQRRKWRCYVESPPWIQEIDTAFDKRTQGKDSEYTRISR